MCLLSFPGLEGPTQPFSELPLIGCRVVTTGLARAATAPQPLSCPRHRPRHGLRGTSAAPPALPRPAGTQPGGMFHLAALAGGHSGCVELLRALGPCDAPPLA